MIKEIFPGITVGYDDPPIPPYCVCCCYCTPYDPSKEDNKDDDEDEGV